jgi:MraZ protein
VARNGTQEGPGGQRQQHMAEHGGRFLGTYEHGLDDKGRMVLPAKIRAQLGETGVLGKADGCLGLWTQEGFDVVTMQLEDKVEAGEATQRALRQFTSHAVEVTPDQQGRIVIPKTLRDYAGLGTEVVITGMRRRAEIWDAARWAAEDLERDDDLRETFTRHRL